MWFDQVSDGGAWAEAVAHLRRDPRMAEVIAAVGPCTLRPRRDHFVVLCKSIYSQQIATKVATILFGRFRDQFPQRRPTPARTLALLAAGDDALLRNCGLSRQKKDYLIDLATHFDAGKIPSRLARMDDEAVIEALTKVRGIGRWTAEMFLIFTLNRPDVLPVDDLGLQTAARDVYGLSARPGPKALRELAEAWRPWRSIATWYLWRKAPGPIAAAGRADAAAVVEAAIGAVSTTGGGKVVKPHAPRVGRGRAKRVK